MKAERGWDNEPRPGYAAPMPTSPTVLVVGSGLTGSTVAHIRIHETKHGSRQQVEGAVLGFELTNAPGCTREALDVSDEVLATLRVTA